MPLFFIRIFWCVPLMSAHRTVHIVYDASEFFIRSGAMIGVRLAGRVQLLEKKHEANIQSEHRGQQQSDATAQQL